MSRLSWALYAHFHLSQPGPGVLGADDHLGEDEGSNPIGLPSHPLNEEHCG